VLTRTATQGPEFDIVSAFLEHGLHNPTGETAVTVFCEPRLETGYPDIVVVHWCRRTASTWPLTRAELTSEDIRLLHFINTARYVSHEDLKRRSNGRQNARALDRLVAADVINASGRLIQRRSLHEIFAVKRIIALEAKISDWRKGLQQAFLNTWFASESFLLLPRVPRRDTIVKTAAQMGVGIIASDQRLSAPQLRPRRDRLPQSYASWLFNEWVWRGFGTVVS
jgi:hypothetical protein